MKHDGTPLANASLTEDPAKDQYLGGTGKEIAIPAGETKLLAKINAASLDANVTGAYYVFEATLTP
jgi:hypothetical protein